MKTACPLLKLYKTVILKYPEWNENIVFVIGILIRGNTKEKIRHLPSNNEKCKDNSSQL